MSEDFLHFPVKDIKSLRILEGVVANTPKHTKDSIFQKVKSLFEKRKKTLDCISLMFQAVISDEVFAQMADPHETMFNYQFRKDFPNMHHMIRSVWFPQDRRDVVALIFDSVFALARFRQMTKAVHDQPPSKQPEKQSFEGRQGLIRSLDRCFLQIAILNNRMNELEDLVKFYIA